MRTETIERKIYTFSELSENAKEKVKQWYLDGKEAEIFTEMCEERILEILSNSDLKVQYSLSSCQGDGFNIYGNLDLKDTLKELDGKFAQEEKAEILKAIEFFNEYYLYFELEENKRYYYCMESYNKNAINYVLADLKENEPEREINFILFEEFLKESIDYISKFCSDFEKSGYEYFYEISESELSEICDVNGYEFLEDGTLY